MPRLLQSRSQAQRWTRDDRHILHESASDRHQHPECDIEIPCGGWYWIVCRSRYHTTIHEKAPVVLLKERTITNMCHSHFATLNNVSSTSAQVRLFYLPGPIFYLHVLSADLELYFQVVSCFPFTIFCSMFLHPKSFRTQFHHSTSHRSIVDIISTNRKLINRSTIACLDVLK